MNYRIDIKRLGYVLRHGEDAVPPDIQKTFDEAIRAREIFRRNIEAGRTAGELFEILDNKLEESGFVNIFRDQFDINADPEKTQINFGFHPLGNNWPADGGGPTISGRSERAHLKIPLYHLFVFEYMMHMPVPEWGKGKHIYMAIEDDVVVTERGVEFLYPPIGQIFLIR